MRFKVEPHIFFIVAILTATLSPKLWAEGASSQFGISYGYLVPDADNTLPHSVFGVKGSAFLGPSISLGGYYLLAGSPERSGGRSFDVSVHGIEAGYHIPSGGGDTTIAVRMGLTKVQTAADDDTKLIFSPYHWGITVGYDYLVFSHMSLGFEGAYLHAERSKTLLEGVQYREDSFSLVTFMAVILFRL